MDLDLFRDLLRVEGLGLEVGENHIVEAAFHRPAGALGVGDIGDLVPLLGANLLENPADQLVVIDDKNSHITFFKQ